MKKTLELIGETYPSGEVVEKKNKKKEKEKKKK